MNAIPSTALHADENLEDALAQARTTRSLALAEARARRAAAAVEGAVALFEQIPAIDHLETLHFLRTSDQPGAGISIVLCAPQGLAAETWDRLMFATISLWKKVERAKANGNEAALNPATVELFKAGLGRMAVEIAATSHLDVHLVNLNACRETIFND